MKKSIVVMTACSVLTLSALAFAQMNDGGKEKMMEKKGCMMGKDMMGMGMMQQMHANLVASNDGGVIVLSGGKLIKYDNQLNVVKQVDLPKSEMGMMGMDNDSDDKSPEPSKPAEDHAAHH